MNSTLLTLLIYATSILVLDRVLGKRNALTDQVLQRSSPIDALRGILATAVVCHHFIVTYSWKVSGVWERPDSDILNNMGAVPVSLFFMITGYLFFGKIYKKTPDWSLMLKSRILRIMPLYIFVILTVFITSLIETKFTLVEPTQIAKELAKWALFIGSSFNGFPSSNYITAGVHWTLRYEWVFYLSLPLIAAVINKSTHAKNKFLIMSALTLAAITPGIYTGLIDLKLTLLFIIGFIPVLIKRNFPRIQESIRHRAVSAIAIFFISIAMLIEESYSLPQMLALGVSFTAIALGNDVLGILRSHGLKYLGEISYSIYLTHGVVLYLAFSMFDFYDFNNSSINEYTLLLSIILIAVSGVSALTYHLIEKPFMLPSNKNATPQPAVN